MLRKTFLQVFFATSLLLACALKPETRSDSASTAGFPDNAIVLDLNRLVYTIANEHDQFYSFIGVRALAMTHLAIHDVLNAIEPQYTPYCFESMSGGADPVSALTEAARSIMTTAYPGRKDTIDLVCDRWLSTVPNGTARSKGIELGSQVAGKLISLRQGDGHEKQGEYTPMTKPGDYRYTPGFDWVWKPDFSYAKPFTLDSVSQFRCPPPPPLASKAYASDWNEVKAYGAKESLVRSADQTHIAHWWAEFGEHAWNRIGRIVATQHDLPLYETARMFALINMNLYDFYLVTFDSKYHYDTWRPITAIHNADTDGNPSTNSDQQWQPEMITPPWPEYPSAHAGVGSAGAEILTHVLGTAQVAFEMESTTALAGSPVRAYTHLDSAANDCADSRIYNGYHFRFATEAGKRQGRDVARYVHAHFLTRLPDK